MRRRQRIIRSAEVPEVINRLHARYGADWLGLLEFGIVADGGPGPDRRAALAQFGDPAAVARTIINHYGDDAAFLGGIANEATTDARRVLPVADIERARRYLR